jgi:putative SOS response-associated peptidase YedK
MCNRFALPATPEELASHFGLSDVSALVPRFNVAPGESILVVRADGRTRVLDRALWGLRAPWTRDASRPQLNVRAETLRGRAGRSSVVRGGRCLVPAGGFFEWRRVGRARQPFYYRLKDSPLLGLAALCAAQASSSDTPARQCAIVTTPPNSLVAFVHDRMPAIVPRDAYGLWLDPASDLAEVLALLTPYPPEAMTGYPVSSLVNRSGVEDPRLLEPAPSETLF